MKVRELIEKLQKANSEAEVYVTPVAIFDELSGSVISAGNLFETYPILKIGEFSNWLTGVEGVCFIFDPEMDSMNIEKAEDDTFIN